MSHQIGDVLFVAGGRPGIVRERSARSSQLEVDVGDQAVREAHKFGYINGLTPSQREQFDEILDDAFKNPEAQKRVEVLQEKIHELQDNPSTRVVAKYLSSEMAHLMNSNGIKPKDYSIDESKVR